MATIDYKEKYEQALEKARQLCAYPTTKPFISDLQDIFPELAESEDEKMANIIRESLANVTSENKLGEYGLSHKDVSDWLEKRGEKKPDEDRYMEGYLNGINDASKTQKSDAWSEEDEKQLNDIIRLLPELDIRHNWLKSLKGRLQPKQEFDEEDEDYLKAAIWYAENPAPKVAKNAMLVEWLKNLRGRVQTQPKQEWSDEDKGNLLDVKCVIDEVWHNQDVREEINYSGEELESLWHWLDNIWQRVEYPKSPLKQTAWSEEDKKMLNDIIMCGECHCYLDAGNIAWLKSLRPQNNITDEELVQAEKDAYNDILDKIEYCSRIPSFGDGWSAAVRYLKKRNAQPRNTWKPSDEQMDALESAVSSLQSTALESLYQDLTKNK